MADGQLVDKNILKTLVPPNALNAENFQELAGKAYIEEMSRGNRYQIIVSELPFQVNKATLVERIAELVELPVSIVSVGPDREQTIFMKG